MVEIIIEWTLSPPDNVFRLDQDLCLRGRIND